LSDQLFYPDGSAVAAVEGIVGKEKSRVKKLKRK